MESDWLHLFLPIVGVEAFWPGILLLGFSAGIIGGCFGGGSWLVVPGLNILGVPVLFSVGTGAAFIAGKRIISSYNLASFGAIDRKPALALFCGSVAGIEGGAALLAALDQAGLGEPVLRWAYAFVFFASACSVLFGLFPVRSENPDDKYFASLLSPFFKRLGAIGFDSALLIPFIIGSTFGFLLGFLGIGGGFLRLTLFTGIWGGLSANVANTHILESIISSLYAAFAFTVKGGVEVLILFMLVLSAAVGDRIGVVAIRHSNSHPMRIGLGLVMLCGMMSVVLMELNRAVPAVVLMLSSLGCFSLCIILGMIAGVIRDSRKEKGIWNG